MGVLRHCATMGIMAAIVVAQLPFVSIPTISEEIERNAFDGEARSFLRLWKYALETDGRGRGPVTKINIEAKTILAPGPQALVNLVPQDAPDPLYGHTPELTALRRGYLLDHMVLEPVEPTNADLTKRGGVNHLTLSGKEVMFRRDARGQMFVNEVPVTRVTSLKDGTQIYILQRILFNNRRKVNVAFHRHNSFQDELNGPIGPPLDLAPIPPVSVRAPAPPPPGVVGPPAIPKGPFIRPPAPPTRLFSPPAPPPSSRVFSPPAPPPSSRFFSPPAPPPSSSRFFSPPAPPPSGFLDAVVLPQRQGQGRVKRQLFPGLEGLGEVDPVVRRAGGGGSLTLPQGFPLDPSPDNCFTEPENRHLRPDVSQSRENKPVDPLTSIDRFATVFKLTGSPGDSIVAILQEEGLTTLLILLETSGLLNYLISGENGPYILLAPSEAAFSRLTQQELRQLSRGNDLSYYLIPLRGQPLPKVTNDSTFMTLLGRELRFNIYGDSMFINGAFVSRRDVPFSHGTIQVMESVLEVPLGDLQAVVVSSGHSFSRVNTLLTVTQMVDSGTYTLLAPPDSAITSKGYSWTRLLMTRALGRDLLARHILKGAWYTEGLLLQRTLTTLAGTSVTFRKDLDGTISANGVPLRSYNLTAVNGVLHLTADVIPEYDLGTDPTTIPNPLLGQTEAPPPAVFSFVGEKVPAIGGLYETPDRDPFLDFIPSPGTGSVKQEGAGASTTDRTPGMVVAVPESQLPPVPSFHEYMESFSVSSVPPAENNIHTVHPDEDGATQEGEPSAVLKQDSLKGSEAPEHHYLSPHEDTGSQIVQPPNQRLLSFLEMLDKTYEGQDEEEEKEEEEEEEGTSTSHHGTSPASDVHDSITTMGDSSTGITEPLQTETIYQGVNEKGNIVVAAAAAVRDDRPGHLPVGETPLLQHPQDRRNCSSTVHNGVTYTAVSHDRRVNTHEYSGVAQQTAPVPPFGRPELLSQEGQVRPSGVPQSLVPPYPVVPEGVAAWSPAGLVTEEERARLDVLALLGRLNLTEFAELIDLAGLTLTLSLRGPWTVFAPSNEAITALPSDVLQQMIYHRRFLRRLVSYHLAPGRFTSSSSFSPGVQLPTLHAGHTLVLNYYTDGQAARWVAGGSIITDLDEGATNGVVHVVDRLLYAPYGDLVTTLALSPILTIFRQLLIDDLSLLDYLTGPGPFTVLVPSDDALRNITFPQDLLARREWVLSHVVQGTWYTAGFSNTWPLVSNTNETIATFVISGQDKITANGAEIIYADITISNGVIHVLKSLLFTPT